MAEFQIRQKRNDEDWAAFGNNLRVLAEKSPGPYFRSPRRVSSQPLSDIMDLIHNSFVPFILFLVPYMLDLLSYYLLFANGIGDVAIVELLVFQCFV